MFGKSSGDTPDFFNSKKAEDFTFWAEKQRTELNSEELTDINKEKKCSKLKERRM